MCICMERLEQKALEYAEKELKNGEEIIQDPLFEDKSWIISEKGLSKPLLGNKLIGRKRYKNSIRKIELKFMPSFCPFCGEKIENKENNHDNTR